MFSAQQGTPLAIITGAAQGIGRRTAELFAAAGYALALLDLKPSPPLPNADVLALTGDLTDESFVASSVAAVHHRFGRIDVLVNNAGFGLIAAVEEASDAAARAIFDVNVFGVLNALRALLPTLRAQRSGHVINISSIGGFTGYAGWGLYNATKFALEGLSEGLHADLAPLGVRVTIVEPGGFRTDFLDGSSLHVEQHVIADYAASAGETRSVPALFNHAQRGEPAKLAAAIVDLPDAADPPLRLQLGPDAVERVEAKLEQVRRELDEWRAVALSTDSDDVEPP
jgi:NAD(P)-dependent dehydrogenase (short-subunit alcohol dehydrogenase family)